MSLHRQPVRFHDINNSIISSCINKERSLFYTNSNHYHDNTTNVSCKVLQYDPAYQSPFLVEAAAVQSSCQMSWTQTPMTTLKVGTTRANVVIMSANRAKPAKPLVVNLLSSSATATASTNRIWPMTDSSNHMRGPKRRRRRQLTVHPQLFCHRQHCRSKRSM